MPERSRRNRRLVTRAHHQGQSSRHCDTDPDALQGTQEEEIGVTRGEQESKRGNRHQDQAHHDERLGSARAIDQRSKNRLQEGIYQAEDRDEHAHPHRFRPRKGRRWQCRHVQRHEDKQNAVSDRVAQARARKRDDNAVTPNALQFLQHVRDYVLRFVRFCTRPLQRCNAPKDNTRDDSDAMSWLSLMRMALELPSYPAHTFSIGRVRRPRRPIHSCIRIDQLRFNSSK
jgi:hypothetical protein